MNRLLSLLGLASPDPQPAPQKPKRKRARRDWRDEAIKRAAERHGKPFECAPAGVPRKVWTGIAQVPVVVDQPQPAPQTVTALRKAKA